MTSRSWVKWMVLDGASLLEYEPFRSEEHPISTLLPSKGIRDHTQGGMGLYIETRALILQGFWILDG